jgi:hypothetical protein
MNVRNVNLNPHRRVIMANAHDDDRYETLGMLPSSLMVLAGLLVAIFPALMQLYLLVTG